MYERPNGVKELGVICARMPQGDTTHYVIKLSDCRVFTTEEKLK